MDMSHFERVSTNLNKLHDELQKRLTSRVWNALVRIGAIWAGWQLLKGTRNTLSFLSDSLIPGYDLVKRYGANSWALITGASDGIGRAFAFELGRLGFNIVLVGRSYEKLTEVSKELSKLQSKPDTKVVVVELSQAHVEGYFEKAFGELTKLDISIVVNNAGKGISGDFSHFSEEEIHETIVINAVAPALITRFFINTLNERTHKSAIINVSSVGAEAPSFEYGLYNSTKSFLNIFSEALSYRFSGKIDILAFKPSFVVTKMIGNKPNIFSITPEQAALSCLNLLGRQNESFGHWKHRLFGPVFRDYGWFRSVTFWLLNRGIKTYQEKQSK